MLPAMFGARYRSEQELGVCKKDDDADPEVEAAKRERQERKLTIVILVVLVGAPLLVWLLVWNVLHPDDYERLFDRPKLRLNLTSAEVQEHLTNHTFLHIGGLHRSGTTLLWQGLSNHTDVASLTFKDGDDRRGREWIDKVFNEGIFLQSVYPKFGLDHNKFLFKKWACQLLRNIPHLEEHLPMIRLRQGVGRFALNPDHHLDEGSRLMNIPNRNLLFNQWGRLWSLDRRVLLEKSPSNMLISSFLHKLWGLGVEKSPARFIFMQRHPVATALATLTAGGMHVDDLTVPDLVEHWLVAEERLRADLTRYFDVAGPEEAARTYRFVTLEQMIATPGIVISDILEWLGLSIDEEDIAEFESGVNRNQNDKYFRRYCLRIASNEEKREEYLEMVAKFADRVLAVSEYDLSKVVEDCHRLLVAKPVGSDAADAEDSKPSKAHDEEI